MKTELEILKEVKFMFDLHSDHSSMCNGYRSLCDKIEELEKTEIILNKIQDVTQEMRELIKNNNNLSEDINLWEDMRWYDFPVEQVWKYGLQNLPLWRYHTQYYDAYFVGSEEMVIQKLKKRLE